MILGIIFIVLGSVLGLQELGIISPDLNFLFPVVLIVLGVSILYCKKSGKGCCDWHGKMKKGKEE